ncbi:MAG: winged helix-turn-helix domain-containing protein [Patiriisocius sp.]|uniref:winged helix-turn-helix domain-containing protein n=1 Tax=Patiriisocius sp. TaxID=2822396 RepID=UPI003EF1985A
MFRNLHLSRLTFSFLIALLIVACSTNEQPQINAATTKVILRQVGNQLLLFQKDSTSVVMPVIALNKSKFELSFENELTFDPADLNKIVSSTFENAQIRANYLVEVIRCDNKEVAYSYQINKEVEKNLISCGGRLVPTDCYMIEFTFFNQNLISKSTGNEYLFYFLVLLVLLFLGFVFYSRYTSFQKIEMDATSTSLGIFNFYPQQLKLVKASQEIPLTQKECELLEILVAKPNQIVTREELTKRIWEDNGVIVGRSLDTYISKLRKKLQEDEAIKIVNVHGVGYKLELT